MRALSLTHKHSDAHGYISINTVPSCSPCAKLLIAWLVLICQIPSALYYWRVSLRVKNTVLSSPVPSLAFPTPHSGLKIAPAPTDCCALAKAKKKKKNQPLSQRPVIYRPKCIRLPPIKVSQAETHNRAQEHGGMVHINVVVSGAGHDQLRSEPDGRGDLLEMWLSSRRHCDNSNVFHLPIFSKKISRGKIEHWVCQSKSVQQ